MTQKTMDSRINTIGSYLKDKFGQKVTKLSLDGDFTCPNRDGTKGTGGCIFCSSQGSGDFAGTIPSQIALLSRKWPNAKHMIYFQNHTNTYGPVSELRQKYYAALNYPNADLVGIAIATRPDCLTDEVYELLAELNEKTFLWVELGLQTIHEDTAENINRCYSLQEYEKAVLRLNKLNIRIVTHLIFGLPKEINKCKVFSETKHEMLQSVKYVCSFGNIFGIKLHMLNVVRGSQLEKLCPDYTPFETIDEYVDLVVRALEIIPSHITIHRLTADAPRPILINPPWSYMKRSILNGIQKKLVQEDTYQGKLAQ